MPEKRHQTRIFEVLRKNGQTAAWLARELGIGRTHLYQISWGERPMPDDFASRVASLLRSTEDELFFLPSECRVHPKSPSTRDMAAV